MKRKARDKGKRVGGVEGEVKVLEGEGEMG